MITTQYDNCTGIFEFGLKQVESKNVMNNIENSFVKTGTLIE